MYTLLYALSVIAINPWGSAQSAVWTLPKIAVLSVLLLLNFFVIVRQRHDVQISTVWRQTAYLWLGLLVIGLFSTIFSPAPRRSLYGQSILADGWLFWVLMAGLILTNALVIRVRPAVFKAQLLGLLIGGGLFALSVYPQLLDKTLDYTSTSGLIKAENPNLLVSEVNLGHQPIGFSSHRGHASVVLALTTLLALISLLKSWLNRWLLWLTLTVASPALWFADTRGGILAVGVGLVYLGWYAFRTRRNYRLVGIATVLLIVGGGVYTAVQRQAEVSVRVLPGLDEDLTHLTSNRSDMWPQALWAIRQRPLLGYGFDGFGTVWPSIVARTDPAIEEVLEIGDHVYKYFDGEQIREGHLEAFYDKAHNFILDWALAVGVAGFLIYLSLLLLLLYVTAQSSASPLEALTVAYLAFTLTWYDAAQFTYLGFWGLSVGLALHRRTNAQADTTKAGYL